MTPNPRLRPRTPWQERFKKYLTPGQPDECWEWQGSRDARGYGRLNRGGRNGSHIKAHRAAYELEHGPFDPALDVCHRCDNPPCCNPAHLFLGDAQANARDMASKGRAPAQRGHSNGREKHSDELVRAVRERAAAGERHTDLAREYGLTSQYVAALVYGQRRRRAGGPIKNLGLGRVERPRPDVGTSRPSPEHLSAIATKGRSVTGPRKGPS